jgi:hypothetical protein
MVMKVCQLCRPAVGGSEKRHNRSLPDVGKMAITVSKHCGNSERSPWLVDVVTGNPLPYRHPRIKNLPARSKVDRSIPAVYIDING